MHITLFPSQAGFDALNALIGGIDKTGKREQWGFKGWPLLHIRPKDPEAVVFQGKRSLMFKVEAALVNEKNKTIATGSVTLRSGSMSFSAGDAAIAAPSGERGILRFRNVNANDLTPVLTIVIRSVNGISAQALSSSGYINITAENIEERLEKERLEREERQEREKILREQFVKLSGDSFLMGSPASEAGRESSETQHQVTVSGFYMGKYEVTQKEWTAVMGSNPSLFKGDNLPIEQVSWYDAIDYCNKRSIREGLRPVYTWNGNSVTWNQSANGYRLPTEAEWEYACRAGTTTPFSTGSNITTNQANYNGNYPYNGNMGGGYRQKTWNVGSGAANAWGLYDMHGNVWEWCWDWYERNAQTDPADASSDTARVRRGGGWYSLARNLRSGLRSYGAPSDQSDDLGFRLTLSL
jgi:formylglycine-generating enzyme required for sulfatase activity